MSTRMLNTLRHAKCMFFAVIFFLLLASLAYLKPLADDLVKDFWILFEYDGMSYILENKLSTIVLSVAVMGEVWLTNAFFSAFEATKISRLAFSCTLMLVAILTIMYAIPPLATANHMVPKINHYLVLVVPLLIIFLKYSLAVAYEFKEKAEIVYVNIPNKMGV